MKSKEAKQFSDLKAKVRGPIQSALTLLDQAGHDYRAGRFSEMEAKIREACNQLLKADNVVA